MKPKRRYQMTLPKYKDFSLNTDWKIFGSWYKYQHLLEQVGCDSRTKRIIFLGYLTTDFKYFEHFVEMMHLYKL